MKKPIDYTLYLCTDRDLMTTDTVEDCVEQALKGGCTVVQLREKSCSSLEFYELALRVQQITNRWNVPLIINDRADIAMAADADGVHVGQSDLPAAVVRRMIGDGKLLGVSASNVQQAIQAQRDGADYIGVGAMYTTATKTDANLVTMETLKEIRRAVSIPIVVIGGINRETIANFRGIGIDGAAVVSAVVSQKDIPSAARNLVQLFRDEGGCQ